MVWWLLRGLSFKSQKGCFYFQKHGLVNVKLKWAKDKTLDAAVAGQRDDKAACFLVSVIASTSEGSVPIYFLRRHRGQLGLPDEVKVSTFIRRYPSIFHESYFGDSGGTPVLMLMKDTTLPLHTIDQLKWDLGLPHDYHHSLVPRFPEVFPLIKLEDERIGLKLLSWDSHLAVSHLQKNAASSGNHGKVYGDCLTFPIGFPRGFGLKRKCMKWLEEWQELLYTSPYIDSSHLDPRTDVSEKQIVGVFHELMHLTIHKQTERKNVSNLRKPLRLPQKFTKVFERHPGIFYISKKNDTQIVVLREAYIGSELLEKHPLVEIRRQYAEMMKQGFLDRSKGFYRESREIDIEI